MKRLLSVFTLLSFILIFTAGAQAGPSLSWVNQSKDYVAGDVVGGWQVLEYKDAVPYNGNGLWTIHGSAGGDTRADNGASIMWFYYPKSSAETRFTTASKAVAFMLEADGNDYYVNFYVDGNLVLENYYMRSLPVRVSDSFYYGTLIVSGLDDKPHTIKIESTDFRASDGRNDFHIYGGAAVAAVPVPAAVWLLGSGLLGLAGIKRKIGK